MKKGRKPAKWCVVLETSPKDFKTTRYAFF